jgi:hypothetical protein
VAWYDTNYKYRVPVLIYSSGGGTLDVRITVPPSFDLFWSTIQSDGDDIRVTTAGGVTLATYKWSSFTYATKTGTIDLDNVTIGAATATLVWLYWGYSSATSGASTFTASSPITGVIFPAEPTGKVYQYAPERPGASKPVIDIAKLPNESRLIWIDFRSVLARSSGGAQSHPQYDEVAQVAVDVQAATVSQASMVDQSKTVVIGRGVVGALIKAGTSGTNYAMIVKVTTSEGYIFEQRIKVRVLAVAE